MKKTALAAMFMAAVVFASCSKEDEKSPEIIIEKDNATLVYGGEFQIKATSDYDLTYKSEDENHAMVDEKGLVKATFVGETNIVVSNTEKSKKVKITVRPEYTLYDDPSQYLGMTKSQIISKLGEPYKSSETSLVYVNYSSYVTYLMVIFENDKANNISVTIENKYMSKLVNFMAERYLYIGQENDIYTYVDNIDKSKIKTTIYVTVYNASYMVAIYTPYSSSN